MLNSVTLTNTYAFNNIEYGAKLDAVGRISYFMLTTIKSGKYKGLPQWKRVIERLVPIEVKQQLNK